MKEIKLQPIKESTEDYEKAERAILELLRKEIYVPLMRELGKPVGMLQNAKGGLLQAIIRGQITFSQGRVAGKLSSSVSKELRDMGAIWDSKSKAYRITKDKLPAEVHQAVQASESRFVAKLAGIDRKLAQILPDQLADKLQVSKFFDSALWKVEDKFKDSIAKLTVSPNLTKDQAARIADEWQENMKVYIKDFAEKEITRLRKDVQTSVLSGNRYEDLVTKIQRSYGVSANKAKFLARQETGLLMAKFKQTRYEAAGVNHYQWQCVSGSKNHPVRPSHKILDGKIFTWDNPPISSMPGEPVRRNNPGQDYNCRCFAKPILRVPDDGNR